MPISVHKLFDLLHMSDSSPSSGRIPFNNASWNHSLITLFVPILLLSLYSNHRAPSAIMTIFTTRTLFPNYLTCFVTSSILPRRVLLLELVYSSHISPKMLLRVYMALRGSDSHTLRNLCKYFFFKRSLIKPKHSPLIDDDNNRQIRKHVIGTSCSMVFIYTVMIQ